MKKNAFTLVEVLVVVAIIAMLVAMLMPTLSAATAIARSVICRNNLHQLAQAFAASSARRSANPDSRSAPGLYPEARFWPEIPMDAVSTKAIYLCPDEPQLLSSLNEYCIWTRPNSVFPMGLEIPFVENTNTRVCREFRPGESQYEAARTIGMPGEDYQLFGFDDGVERDLWGGSIDMQIKVTKTVPRIGIRVDSGYRGHSTGRLSLMHGGKIVPGWEDFRNVSQGATFVLGSGATNYGYNYAINIYRPAPGAIVLLDYRRLIANNGEDMTKELSDSARHRGKCNLLYADGSVGARGPTELDPAIGANADLWKAQ